MQSNFISSVRLRLPQQNQPASFSEHATYAPLRCLNKALDLLLRYVFANDVFVLRCLCSQVVHEHKNYPTIFARKMTIAYANSHRDMPRATGTYMKKSIFHHTRLFLRQVPFVILKPRYFDGGKESLACGVVLHVGA